MKRLSFLILFTVFFFFLSIHPSFAQSYSSDYRIYYEQSKNESLATHAIYEITLTNNQNDTYVDNYRISFPTIFPIINISAHDRYGAITPQLITDKNLITMQFALHESAVGKGKSNTLTIEFDHKNTVDSYGLVTEYLIPVIAPSNGSHFSYSVQIPDGYTKLSKADPKPDRIEQGVALWKDPQTRFISLSFSDTQYYNLHLNYHLSNVEGRYVTTEIALPPDTGYQKTLIDHIEPLPDSVHRDIDGNLMAVYTLKPHADPIVQVNAHLLLTRAPRAEVVAEENRALREQSSYLLNPNTLWNIGNTETRFDNPQKIFEFVSKKLTYAKEDISPSHKRQGAFMTLQDQTNALCTEFSDSFIAIARKERVYARELQGYAYNHGVEIQPLNLNNVLLHSWQEYYDHDQRRWIQVDATWQNTSGVDYFTNLDLNHLVFVRHGKEETYPLPSGMYRGASNQDSSQDVVVEPTATQPKEHKELRVVGARVEKSIVDGKMYRGSITIRNEGNGYRYNLGLKLKSNNLVFSNVSSVTIPVLAPMEQTTVEFDYNTSSVIFEPRKTSLTVQLDNQSLITYPISVTPRSYTTTVTLSGIVLLVLVMIWVAVRRLKKV